MYRVAKYVLDNTAGTANLLDILVNEKHKVKKLIVASSMSIYGEGSYLCPECGKVAPALRPESQLKEKNWEVHCPRCSRKLKPIPTPEEKELFPTSIYAMSKRHQEEMCLLIGKTYGIPTVALRYFNVYGMRQSLSNPYTGVCAIFAAQVKNNHPPVVYEDGLQSRDFINVRDIVAANLFVMKEKRADYRYFNVGAGEPRAILEIANLLISLHRKDLKPKIAHAYRKGDIRHCFADNSKLKGLGFKLSVPFKEGLSELIAWQRQVRSPDLTGLAQKELQQKGLVVK
jgi:dTDP-L-rhamnose 4-epimerase